MNREQLMSGLAEDAQYFRPTMFSVYGVDGDGRPFLGWGIQLGDREAFFCRPGTSETWISTSAEQVKATFDRTGDARLLWLDD